MTETNNDDCVKPAMVDTTEVVTTAEPNCAPETEQIKDNLAMLFFMQERLNDYVFKNKNITANDGSPLTTQVFRQEVQSALMYDRPLGPNSNAAQWMRNYLEALLHEVIELKDEIPWKWWSKSAVPMPKVREEIIDAWHFLISESLAAGMTPNDVIAAYSAKYAENVRRQQNDYVARGDVAA